MQVHVHSAGTHSSMKHLNVPDLSLLASICCIPQVSTAAMPERQTMSPRAWAWGAMWQRTGSLCWARAARLGAVLFEHGGVFGVGAVGLVPGAPVVRILFVVVAALEAVPACGRANARGKGQATKQQRTSAFQMQVRMPLAPRSWPHR